jgi:signal transduction histidine kinase
VQFRENFEQRSKILLETTLETFLAGLDNAMMLGNQKNVQHIVDKVSLSKSVDHIRIFDDLGNIMYSTDTSEVGKEMEIVAPHHLQEPLDQKRIFLIKSEDIYSVTIPVENKPSCQACHGEKSSIAYLDIDTDLTQAEVNFYTGSIHVLFLAIAIIIVLFFGFYFLFNHFINRPLTKFITALEEVERGNLSLQIPVKKQDEFGVLGRHFNRMVSKIRESQETIEELHSEQLRRADKLVTLGELAAEMAHEINNPAGIIMSRADYLKIEAFKDQGMLKYSEDFDVIIDQITKVSKITSNILKYGKKLPKEFHTFDLVKVVKESLSILEPRIIKKKINLTKQIDSDTCEIYGDSQQIEQVVINLVNNAIEALQDLRELTIGIQGNQNECKFWVKDSGEGIAEEALEQIYSPFFTTKPPEMGTGLGLYIVRNICKNHNAEISCESTLGKGTTFTITFKKMNTQL